MAGKGPNGKKLSTSELGYGYPHQVRRKRLEPLVRAGVLPCAKCGEMILPGEPWDLGHTDDRGGYTGAEHADCNRKAGAAKAQESKADMRWSRDWDKPRQ